MIAVQKRTWRQRHPAASAGVCIAVMTLLIAVVGSMVARGIAHGATGADGVQACQVRPLSTAPEGGAVEGAPGPLVVAEVVVPTSGTIAIRGADNLVCMAEVGAGPQEIVSIPRHLEHFTVWLGGLKLAESR